MNWTAHIPISIKCARSTNNSVSEEVTKSIPEARADPPQPFFTANDVDANCACEGQTAYHQGQQESNVFRLRH